MSDKGHGYSTRRLIVMTRRYPQSSRWRSTHGRRSSGLRQAIASRCGQVAHLVLTRTAAFSLGQPTTTSSGIWSLDKLVAFGAIAHPSIVADPEAARAALLLGRVAVVWGAGRHPPGDPHVSESVVLAFELKPVAALDLILREHDQPHPCRLSGVVHQIAGEHVHRVPDAEQAPVLGVQRELYPHRIIPVGVQETGAGAQRLPVIACVEPAGEHLADARLPVLVRALRLHVPANPDAGEVRFLVQLLDGIDLVVIDDDLADALLWLVLPANRSGHQMLVIIHGCRDVVGRAQHRPRDRLVLFVPPDEKQALLGQLPQQLVNARWLGDEGRKVVA